MNKNDILNIPKEELVSLIFMIYSCLLNFRDFDDLIAGLKEFNNELHSQVNKHSKFI